MGPAYSILNYGSLSPGGKASTVDSHLFGGTPRVYTCIDQMADLIQKGRDIAVRCYAREPDKIVIPYRQSDFEWIQRNNRRITLALEGYLGILDCHYGPHKWVTFFGRLDWRAPQLFLFKPIPDALKVFF